MANNFLFELRKELVSLGQSTAQFIRKELNKVDASDIETKDRNSLVSYVDKEAERRIVEHLSAITPEYGFITEEDTDDSVHQDNIWIIDPLDGTTNYLNRIPHFSISIALQSKGDLVLGMVYEVMLDIAYTAIRGFGAWENDKTMKVSQTVKMSEAIVVTGFPYKREFEIDHTLGILKYCILNARGIRRLGSAALDLAYVAAGKLDIYYENTLNIWDLAAGALLVKEAGGQISDYKGEHNYLDEGHIVAANPHLHPKILAAVQSHL